ncbi:hypothetical protein CEQ90_16720 [Lewinellaceae bacterium SD302]|nr:hypothetical protein CEQ90_16720 [Lewinellaceae bacterium SD302]
MADHVSYEDSVKGVYKGLILLAIVTLVEVGFSLFGKGHILGGEALSDYTWFIYLIGIILIGLSLYKAYFIVYEFMHMGYEVKGLAASVLLPLVLLVWALVAFFQEGNAWKQNRETVQERNEMGAEKYEQSGQTYDLSTGTGEE